MVLDVRPTFIKLVLCKSNTCFISPPTKLSLLINVLLLITYSWRCYASEGLLAYTTALRHLKSRAHLREGRNIKIKKWTIQSIINESKHTEDGSHKGHRTVGSFSFTFITLPAAEAQQGKHKQVGSPRGNVSKNDRSIPVAGIRPSDCANATPQTFFPRFRSTLNQVIQASRPFFILLNPMASR